MGAVAVCVPWRAGQRDREALWGRVRPFLEELGWPIVLGDREGLWSRAAACNEAAAAAGDWDVAVFADADTIPEAAAVRRAVERVSSEGGALRPHNKLWNLSKAETRRVLARGLGSILPRSTNPGGGLLVVARDAFEEVGGYDERFVGWGHEDSVIDTRLLVGSSWDHMPGNAWHLWHPRDATDTPERQANHAMMIEVQRRHRDRIARESARRGYDVGAIL